MSNAKSNPKRVIVVLQRGWVVTGFLTQNGTKCTLTDAAVVRYWGTTKGIGELAEKGPLSCTKLDPVQSCDYHELTAILTINCNEEAWQKK